MLSTVVPGLLSSMSTNSISIDVFYHFICGKLRNNEENESKSDIT
jgi:hypothetical protein